MSPVKFSLRYPSVTLILTAMAVFVGLYSFLYMPRTEDPTITIRTGLVMALYPGATSEQVEKQVTKTLEKHIFKFPEVRKGKTYSTSRPGLVVMNVELQDYVKDSDVVWAKIRHEMIETRAAGELPEGVQGPLVISDFGDTVAMLIAIHGKRYGYRELRDYVDTIKDELRTIPDVGKLATYGEQSEQIWITGDLERMAQYFVDPGKVILALRNRNIIESSGSFDAGSTKIPLRTTGLFNTEEQIGNVLVDVSRTGQPVYIRDFANVERRYQDPTFMTRYDGKPCLMLSVEMQKGKNIVELGESIREAFTRLRSVLPPDLKIDFIANQPKVVKESITHLSREFMIAILSVVFVTIILLPIRVAVITALAIPISIFITLGAMDAIGLALHQVSIAALIVVLGIVVDNAIVIVDNYVDLLDRKVPRDEAAWRCVSEVIVPVLSATAAIIFAFLPLLILTGSAGEFIRALPITIAVALVVSTIVAVMPTPIFCRFFIKKGLQDHENGAVEQGKPKFNFLDLLQSGYKVIIGFFMRYKVIAMATGVGALVLGVVLFRFVPQQFFPTAERNQFVIDVWMPEGSRIEATDAVMRHIEAFMKAQKGIEHFATFIGQSAPRFYYNVDPQEPDAAYGQFIVNTTSAEETPVLVNELRTKLASVAPEALVIVKELQQGMSLSAPVEVRIVGEDTQELKSIGARVEKMMAAVPYSTFVHSDYLNDSSMVDVRVNNELANRLGITNSSISKVVAGAFDGAPVSTFWEGDRSVTILLRLTKASRSTFGDLSDTYVGSPLTGARVPLRALATLKPEWQTSRIVRRNGVRTLTVLSFVEKGHYPSELLNAIRSELEKLQLPPGYRIEYGGDKSNTDETLPTMITALGISIVAIFLVLLIQFKNLTDTLLVMSSIPLALPGGVLGLVITRNPFGFTAFMGIISLSGIVVRNAIILVDYINEKIREGHPLQQAAREAGERRLRPIFLTTMATAAGVLPMILSKSSMWSPLASVIAVGLIWSMVIALLIIPVLFVIVKSRMLKTSSAVAAALLAALIFAAAPAHAQTKRLTLPEAVNLAVKGNSGLKIARLKVVEKARKVASVRADNFPKLSNYTWYMGFSSSQAVSIPVGLIPVPVQKAVAGQGSSTFFLNGTVLAQPVTQLLKIHEATGIARSDESIAESDEQKARNDVILAAHQLYYGILIANAQKEAAEAGLAAAQENLRDAQKAVIAKNVLEVAVTEARTAVLKNKQSLLAATIQSADLNAELDQLLDLPLDTQLELSDPGPSKGPAGSRDFYLQRAFCQNPEIRAAEATVVKADRGVNAARDEYIPDVTLFAANTYQHGASFLTNNIGSFGVMVSWDIWDWGKRNDVIGERCAQMSQAEENVRRVHDEIAVEVDNAYRKLENQKSLMDVAGEALALQKERLRLESNQLKTATISHTKYEEAVAEFKSAQSDDLQARLGFDLAVAELSRIAGTFDECRTQTH